ncbi:hypothetical protein L218DRAFT_744125 [Marasmius fiardii PR-910]|nr:hypothetical protein L218DRAFT_744125 [Marasmius fiardii PR-910]
MTVVIVRTAHYFVRLPLISSDIMDPISVLTTVISTAKFLIDWIDAHRSLREYTLSNIQSTIRNIHDSILCSLLEKSELQLLDSRISGPLETLYDVLCKTQDHLVNWEQSKSRPITKIWNTMNPWATLDKLKKDEKNLMISMQILGTAIIAIYTPTLTSNARQALPIDISSNSDLKAFWTSEIGEKMSNCSIENLALALDRYFNVQLKKQSRELLASRLDNFGKGYVTLANFDYFVGGRSVLEALTDLGVIQGHLPDRIPSVESDQETLNTVASPPKLIPVDENPASQSGKLAALCHPLDQKSIVESEWEISSTATAVFLPILILVDDNPGSQSETLAYAGELGVERYVFESTEAAKDWIEQNEDLLRRADQADQLRIISDNARWEIDIDSCDTSHRPSMNLRAGETILRYVRGRQYKAPFLIFAGQSMPMTQYVRQYSNAGSTEWQQVVCSFLDGLVKSENADDGWWRDYDVTPKWLVQPLLIWVDDEIRKHITNLDYAKSIDIEVVSFTTTDAAKTWITCNESKFSHCFSF